MGRPTTTTNFLKQSLANHCLQRLRQHRTHYVFLGCRKHVDETIDVLGDKGGM